MYIDNNILKIIFKTGENEENLQQVVDDYEDSLSDIFFEVVKKYMGTAEIPKPKTPETMEFIKYLVYPDKYTEEQATQIIIYGLKTISTTPAFQEMLEAGLNSFNESLIKGQLPDLSKEEIQKLKEYSDSIDKKTTSALETLNRYRSNITERMLNKPTIQTQ